MKFKHFLYALFFVPLISFGQQKISGTITSEDDGSPLPGASIIVQDKDS